MLVEFITVEFYWLRKEWIVNCCFFNLDEKISSWYRNSSFTILFTDSSSHDSSRFLLISRSLIVTRFLSSDQAVFKNLETRVQMNEFENVRKASTITHITHLSDTIQLVSLRAVEQARVWSKSSLLSVVKIENSKTAFSQRPQRGFAAKTRRKKSKILSFLNNTVNFQAFFDLSSKNSLIYCYFLIYLTCFKSSSHRRRDITHL
jgi:hypothetical protein